MTFFRLAIAATLAATAIALPVAAAAQPAAAAPAGCPPVTQTAAAGFFNSAVPGQLAHDHVPGVVVSVVSGGRTVFDQGYGFADVEDRVPFTPDRSLVRIASITKLFTWTAVMQQVQAGRLDLNADVNRYLTGFRIPATYPQPITLQNLMDHTAGFEDRVVGTAARTAADVPPLGEYLAAHLPARIRPPGVVSAYSNYGAALAGYIVSLASGEPYDRYVQEHILAPLGMTHTTATEPVPAALSGDLARSYDTDATPPRRVPFEFDPMTPDGSVSATADDMARFMAAHLGAGTPILDPATAALMHGHSFAADPRLSGYAHGFKERTINGHQVLMHDGGWEGFVSGLLLVPGCDLGLFLSANGTGGSDTLAALVQGFFDRFAPVTADPARPSTSDTGTPEPGFYAPARHNESTVERIVTLLGSARLTVGADGTVHFGGSTWTPQGGGLYRKADGTDHLVFRDGYLITDVTSYQLLDRAHTLPVNLVVLAAFAVVALSALALPLVAAWRRLRHRAARGSGTWRWSRALAASAALLGLGFLVGLLLTLLGDTSAFIYGMPLTFRLLLAVPVVVLLAAAGAAATTVVGWRGAGLAARIHQVVLLAGLVTLAWFLTQWNLVGW